MVETTFSVVMLGVFLWAIRFLLPKALREHDALGVVTSILTAVFALLAWLLIGVRVRG